jgi:Fe-Mn family superoxide dismutase
MAFTLPTLPYAKDALAPYMSAETLDYHHGKHHQAYCDKTNDMISGTDLENASIEEIIKKSHQSNQGLFNNAAQFYNHVHFWNWMKPNGGGSKLPGKLDEMITRDLGGYDAFRKSFIEAGIGQFGSGWCWLSLKDGKLEVTKTPNGENPLVHGGKPLLGCDVWEHSYYIDYRNARPKYLEAFLDHLVNWDYVESLLD